VNVRLAENLALGKTARQISTHLAAATSAVNGDLITASCTKNDTANPWWSVDLGQYYHICRVTVAFYGSDYRCKYNFTFLTFLHIHLSSPESSTKENK